MHMDLSGHECVMHDSSVGPINARACTIEKIIQSNLVGAFWSLLIPGRLALSILERVIFALAGKLLSTCRGWLWGATCLH